MKKEELSFGLDEARGTAAEAGEKVVPTFCAMCGPAGNCGVYAFVKDGRFTKVAGMKESPANLGALCPRGHAAPQWVYSPERLKHPLRRVGAKGEGRFQEITWSDALGIIAEKLKEQKEKYGAESLGILSPAKRTYADYLYRFLMVHGSPNYGHSGICAMQMGFAFSYTVGDWPKPVDYANSDLVLVWGKQPVYSGPALEGARAFVEAKTRGARLIAIKPSVEPDVSLADEWIAIRPGTDAALALAMLHVVTGENLIDEDFVGRWCYGYDLLKEHVRKYPPSWAETITGVPARRIEGIARLFATTRRAGIDLGNGVEHAPSSNDAIRAVAILIAITGHLDRPGGNMFGSPGTTPRPRGVHLRDRYTQEWVDRLVSPEFPRAFQPFLEGTSSAYFGLFDGVLTGKPYPMRTIIAPGTQALASTRGPKRVAEALKKLDFYVVADVSRTVDVPYADIVIPLATPYEIDHPFEMRGNWIMARNRVIEPLHSSKSMFGFLCDLAVEMGYGADFWEGSMEASQNEQLEPLGMTIDELRSHPTGITYQPTPREYEKYETAFKRKSPRLSGAPFLPQGKVAIYNTSFEEAGYNALPEWREPPESITGTPDLVKAYPLILSDYHTSDVYTASWQRNVPNLREIRPFPTLHIHPDAAGVRGIRNGDWVRVESPHGWTSVKAEVYPGIRPDTVMMLHGWWQGCKELGFDDFPLFDGGANVNNMYSTDPAKAFDPVVTAMSSQTLVEVSRETDREEIDDPAARSGASGGAWKKRAKPPMEYGFSFEKDRCIQCRGCEVACKSWRDTEPGIRWRRVSGVWRGRYPEVKSVPVSVSCMHCLDPECVKSCPVDAIVKRETDGVVEVDRDKCTGCRACLESCPFGVPQFDGDGKMQKCDMCRGETVLAEASPPCVRTCPTKALGLRVMEAEEKLIQETDLKGLLSGPDDGTDHGK